MTGLLWFDDTQGRPTGDKVARAVARYRTKYGQEPTHCYVHQDCGDLEHSAGVKVAKSRTVLPNHFFIVRQEKRK